MHRVPRSFEPGPQIGSYQGQPIYDTLTDNHGVVRVFKGIVHHWDLSSHKPGCVVTSPGLLYEVQE